jgi:hypothetical protein
MDTNSERGTERRVPDTARRDAWPELKEPRWALENAFIDEFLATRGYTLHSINRLPPGDRDPLLRAALRFASLRLAEVEARAHLVDEMGGQE